MSFEEYLSFKKIDSAAFHHSQPLVWEEWKHDYSEMHPNSFTAQKLFLINKIRRKHPVKEPQESQASATPVTAPPRPKPIMRPKIN